MRSFRKIFFILLLAHILLAACGHAASKFAANADTAAADGEWTMFGRDARHSRYSKTDIAGDNLGIAWKYPLSAKNPTIQCAEDLDGDGDDELLVIFGERLCAYRADGSLYWRASGGVADEIGNVIAVEDLDLDGTKDIITGNKCANDSFGDYRLARLTVLNAMTGAVEFSRDFFDYSLGHCGATGNGSANELNISNTKLVNIDSDPNMEIIVFPHYAHIFAALDFSGGVKNAETIFLQPYPNNGADGVVAADADSDGAAEIITAWFGEISVFNAATGTLKYKFRFSTGDSDGASFLYDIDDDGKQEYIRLSYLLGEIAAINIETDSANLLWQIKTGGELVYCPNILSDFDNDGAEDILFSVKGEGMRLLDSRDGSTKWSIASRYPKGAYDANKNGAPEIYASDTIDGGNAYIYEWGDGKFRQIFYANRKWIKTAETTNTAAFENANPYSLSLPSVFPRNGKILLSSATDIFAYDTEITTPTLAYQYNYSQGSSPLSLEAETLTIGSNKNLKSQRTLLFSDDGFLTVLDSDGSQTTRLATQSGWLFDPLVADINGDGKNEIIIRKNTKSAPATKYYYGDMEIIDANSADLNNPPHKAGFGFSGFFYYYPVHQYYSPVVADIDSDGAKETLLKQDTSTLSLIKSDGGTSWTVADSGLYFGVGNFDGDNVLDVWTATRGHFIRLLSGADGSLIRASDKDSAWIPCVTDINSDGIDDIATLGENNFVYAYDGKTLTDLWKDNSNCALCNQGCVALGDFDGDGEDEFCSSGNFGIVVYEKNGALLWEQKQYNTEGFKQHFAAICDANGDGADDIIHPSNHGVYAFNGKNGELLWKYIPIAKVAASSAAAANADSDIYPEIFVSLDSGLLIGLDGKTGALDFKFNFGRQCGSPIIADTDSDGECEILISSGGSLYCFDKNQPPPKPPNLMQIY